MTWVRTSPLVAAALAVAACALAALTHPYAAVALGSIVATLAGTLAHASADRPRRILWSAVAAGGLAEGARALLPSPEIALGSETGLATLRATLAAPIRALIPPPESGLVLGMVLGDRSGIPPDVRDAFGATGTAHMLAIAGLHLAVITGVVAALFRRTPRIVAAGATAASAAGYAVLAGAAPSVVRAALMTIAGAVPLAIGRPGLAANALGAAAAVMLIADPAAIAEPSFQMSVGATGGLVTLRSRIAAMLPGPRAVADPVATTLAASVATIPVSAAAFARVSIVSPLVNLIAVPFLAPIVVFGAATAIVGSIAPAAAIPLAAAAYLSARAARGVVEAGAALPFAAVPVPPGFATGVALSAVLIVAFGSAALVSRGALPRPALPRIRPMPGRRAAVLGALVIAVVAAAAGAALVVRPAALRLHALDIGQGDAFLLESDGRYALIDGGPDANLLLRRLGEVLPPWRRHIDLIALTHEHVDHGAGLLGVVDRYSIGLAVEPPGMSDVPFVRLWSEKLGAAHVPRRALRQGAVIELGRTTIRVLSPDEHRVDFPSLALLVTSASSSALFMGDATDPAIADMLLDPAALRARVYVPPHHGAASAYGQALVDAVRPEAAVISVGLNNKYGHPTPATLDALRRVPVYRTDLCGTVEIDLDERPLVARTTKTAVPPGRGGSLPCASAPG